ncbi:MAG: hypothetical protein ACYDAB_15770 [bacterium]
MLTELEEFRLYQIAGRVGKLRAFLREHDLPAPDCVNEWYEFLAAVKGIQGNLNNDVAFIATLMAKEYLTKHFQISDFDAAEKRQGASGIDIVARTHDGKCVVAEIKSTFPYGTDRFGGNQTDTIRRDLVRLAATQADLKFFFVTESKSFDILKGRRNSWKAQGVRIVLLSTEERECLRGGANLQGCTELRL